MKSPLEGLLLMEALNSTDPEHLRGLLFFYRGIKQAHTTLERPDKTLELLVELAHKDEETAVETLVGFIHSEEMYILAKENPSKYFHLMNLINNLLPALGSSKEDGAQDSATPQ